MKSVESEESVCKFQTSATVLDFVTDETRLAVTYAFPNPLAEKITS